MPTGDKTGFIDKEHDQDKGFLRVLHWPSSMFTYYSWARLIGYWAQTGQSPALKWIDKHVVGKENLNVISPEARKYWGFVEAAAFGLVATVSFFAEKNHFKNTLYDAIAAERGTNPEDTNIFSLYKSENPFVRSLRQRFTMQQTTRFPAALAFAKSIVAGVMLVTLNYTLERSIFVSNNAFDLLQNMIYEVQKLKVSGNRDEERLYTGLERAVQRTLKENHRPKLSEAQLNANKMVLERLTHNILNEKFNVKEAVYILGELANHPERTSQLLLDLEKIEQIGLKGFARQKAQVASRKSPVNTVIEQGKRSFGQMAAVSASQPGMA